MNGTKYEDRRNFWTELKGLKVKRVEEGGEGETKEWMKWREEQKTKDKKRVIGRAGDKKQTNKQGWSKRWRWEMEEEG